MKTIIRSILLVLLALAGCKSKDNSSNQDSTSNQKQAEQSVIIHFKYGYSELNPLYYLEDELEKVIQMKKLGEYDGHEVSMDLSDGYLYMYSPDAKKLYDEIKQTLESTDFMKGATVKIRLGPLAEGAVEIVVKIE